MPHCSTLSTEPDMVTLLSSDTEEVLGLLFPNHPHALVVICLMIGLKLMIWWQVFMLL
jgi:hypothetical protein